MVVNFVQQIPTLDIMYNATVPTCQLQKPRGMKNELHKLPQAIRICVG